jgi:UDP-glucose 4-epimerase
MKVVVTGGAGFIGANLCRALVTSGVDDVVVIDDLTTGRRDNLDGVDVTFVESTILDRDVLDATFEGTTTVVHLAARPSVQRSIADPGASHEANTTGTLEVLEAARRAGGPHVIVASSSSVYGANPTLPKHEDLSTRPMSPYAATKLAAEAYALAWQEAYGMPVLAFRFFNVFGPLQLPGHAYAAVIPAFASAALAGQPLQVQGDGKQSRDFTYVGTVAKVLTTAVHAGTSDPEPVNLAYGSRVDLLALIELIEKVLGHPVQVAHVDPRPGDVRHSQADDSRVRALFPDVEPVPLEDGLRTTIDWLAGRIET